MTEEYIMRGRAASQCVVKKQGGTPGGSKEGQVLAVVGTHSGGVPSGLLPRA